MTAGILVYMFKGAHVLLAQRKTGVSVDKLNAPGGAVTFGETALRGAARLVQQTVGVTPVLSEPLGEVLYHHPVHGNWKVTVFRTESFTGDPVETDTMVPVWVPVDAVPYDRMWAGDDEWLPYVVANEPFMAELWFDENDKIRQKDIQERKA